MLHLAIAGLSTGHKIGLAVVGVTFISFALSVSFLAPRKWPDFPGEHGMSVFILACVVLFAAMITAVLVFGREKPEHRSGAQVTHVQSHLRL
jgi:heme/copper-type cytochrome/quinol oxidase subunit 3